MASLRMIPDVVWAWGPAVLVLVGIYVLVRQFAKAASEATSRIFDVVVTEFLSAQRDQADAMQQVAACIKAQRERADLQNEKLLLFMKVLRNEVLDLKRDIGKLAKEAQP